MKSLQHLVRFFIVACPVPPMMVGTFMVVSAVAAAILLLDPARAGMLVTPVVVLQLFAAASGFAGPACRGHYDLVLTAGAGRLRVALAHWASSIAPGVASWLAVGCVEAARRGPAQSDVFASGTCWAMFLVSTLPWALSVRLPRFSASVGWLLLLVTASAIVPPQQVAEWERVSSDGLAHALSAARSLFYPLGSVGTHMDDSAWLTAAPGFVVAAGAMFLAFRWVVRADFPLEAAQ
jgi:hypothetical protein